MADFKISFKITGHNEGGYANNPNDRGGQTYAGISRNNWPNWVGWQLIDNYKAKNGIIGIDKAMANNPNMESAIESFYKKNFWDVNKLDLINDQQIADTVYDFGVNSGVGQAAKTLQKVVGVSVDGIIGNQTVDAVNKGDAESIHNSYNLYRDEFYTELAKKSGQSQFLKSWLSRLKPYQK